MGLEGDLNLSGQGGRKSISPLWGTQGGREALGLLRDHTLQRRAPKDWAGGAGEPWGSSS